MTQYIGKRDHNCFGDIERRAKLAARAEYFGYLLIPVESENTIGEKATYEYELTVESNMETTHTLKPSEVSKLLAEWEELEVSDLIAGLPEGYVLVELIGKLGQRIGYTLFDEDKEVLAGIQRDPASAGEVNMVSQLMRYNQSLRKGGKD